MASYIPPAAGADGITLQNVGGVLSLKAAPFSLGSGGVGPNGAAFGACSGLFTAGSTEANQQVGVGFAGFAQEVWVHINAAISVLDRIVTLRINGADTAVTLTIPALSVAGLYSATGFNVAIAKGDRACWGFTGAGNDSGVRFIMALKGLATA